MTTNQVNTTLSNQIYLSRDNIRNQIIEYLQYYLELENVDLLKSSFLSFLINILSTLTSNILFYNSSCYKEFFLTTAQLPESIFNLSAFLGYNTKEASYSTVNVLMNIPFGFDDVNTRINIPEGFKFYAGDIEFVTFYDTEINVTNNSMATVTSTQDETKVYNIPVLIDTTSDITSFSFVLPLRQYKEVIQEFQIDDDISLYQFITLDVPLDGKVSTLDVEIKDPNGSSWRTYTEFNSLYLMSSSDYGYVSRTTVNGRRLTFGNNLIGIQPLGGSTVKVTTKITEGSNGNVIASSIVRGDRIYTTNLAGQTKIVNYTVTNPSPAINGEDEESIQEVRSNAISNLVALKRLVSEYDFQHSGSILEDIPISSNTIPVLKRSDVKINEIQLFTILNYGTTTRTSDVTGEDVTEPTIVPTKNVSYEVPIETTYIPRETVIEKGDNEFYTLFDINVDLINACAFYNYIMYEIENVPVLVSNYGSDYNITCSKLNIKKQGTDAIFELYYNSSEVDYNLCTAELNEVTYSRIYEMTNDSVNKKFTYTFSPYTLFPDGNIDLEFTIYKDDGDPIATYSSSVTFRKSLDNFMLSNVYIDTTSNITTIFDIPVIEKEYYDSIVKKDFELEILQTMMNLMDFKSYRMLTDFINLKFTNTVGTMTNMNYNPVTKINVKDIGTLTPPLNPLINDRYIIGFTESGEWANKYGKIAQCIDTTGVNIWYYYTPVTDDIVYVTEKQKKYIYNGNKWVVPEYQIPLTIEIEVFKDTSYYGSDIQLSNVVKDTLLDTYSSRFGPNTTLYKSEIIKTVQEIEGVRNCNLIQPATNIFFEYDIDTLTEDELMEYSPEYVYFTEDSIIVRVYS